MFNNNLSPVDFADALLGIDACEEAREWAAGLDYVNAWDTCPNPVWMLFLTNATAPLSEMINETLICCFARQVVHLTTDPRVLACIETREAWARGEVSDEVRETAMATAWAVARVTAWAVARAAAMYSAEESAWAAARAAARVAAGDAAEAATWAAVVAAAEDETWVATRAAARDEAWDTAWIAARDETWAIQCDIIRELVPRPSLG